MSREFEFGVSLLRKIYKELQTLSKLEDKNSVKELVKAIINPIVASAYQIKVGNGPQKERLLEVLFALIKEIRELQNLEKVRSMAFELIQILDTLEVEATLKEEGAQQ